MNAKIAYFVHDLSDPAVHRRVRMLRLGGGSVTPIGFRRTSEPIDMVEGRGAIDLGRTSDGMLGRRVVSLAGALTRLDRLGEQVRGADALVARNLEMLFLAARARKLHAPNAALVYECLDIHRMLLSRQLKSGLLRLFESGLWHNVDLLLTSSPAFVRNYFAPRGFPSPIRLVENKVLLVDERQSDCPRPRPTPGPPWRIGWFGMIRCRKSLEILTSLARKADGDVEIVIRGRPSGAVFPDFDAAIANSPHIRFGGIYRNPDDLPAIYGDVHLSWAIDYYEAGENSTWLLPNRIYEGSVYGAVPIALAGVETGSWLAKRGAGVVLDEPLEQQLAGFLGSLDAASYSRLTDQMEALPRSDLVDDRSDCRELVAAICGDTAAPSDQLVYSRVSA
ncbi:succinoglycan biosynthesis protein ExoL [Rhizobiales bacterium GAS191]|nr:succinoglycan biosynthesis protein ExoL [Rhizobiales bacterium GAS113]SEE13702.1 succinoglycan biosynthesis protein ExoL [Rhizobiales bacterium GAS188]SEE43424.1 succinoglycan biosynthesis protein ExoL [Rhizobiales bacterium GAS191]